MVSPGKCICLLVFLVVQITVSYCSNESGRRPYIVYLGNAPESRSTARVGHHNLLSSAIVEEQTTSRDVLIHSYVKSFNAFAAMLRPEEAEKLSGMDGIISVFPSAVHKLHTTRSWDYLGFPQNARRHARESKMVVGMLDTGISPHAPSFYDKGFGPPPAKWQGRCFTSKSYNFTCNNKVVGARVYRLLGGLTPPDIPSPADTEGHGTHTSSTATGSTVGHASLYGLGQGTARGAVPSARVAMYKVCWQDGCQEIDMLAAFDQAIFDGVDVLSASIGGAPAQYWGDVLSIGSFHAMKKGILTCLSGGNDGPTLMTVSNISPWVMTVAASSIDRQFRTDVRLGNGKKFRGVSINTFSAGKKMSPLITGAQASIGKSDGSASHCMDGSLDKHKVKGKIVFCNNGFQPDVTVKALGGVGVIKMGDGFMMDVAFSSVLPSTTIDSKDVASIGKYINYTRSPQAIVYKSGTINVTVPFVASFSSRGPNPISVNILKPDISAPGLDILAAWTRLSSITGAPYDNRLADFNIVSGTSMACPHVSGVAAYIKSFHPLWSPAAIKSAIMTTAKEMRSAKRSQDAEYGYGSGQIDPVRALDPGLIYDMNETSYISFLCKEGYDAKMLALLEGNNSTECPSKGHEFGGADGLNYPSMHHGVASVKHPISAIFRRTVTNVGKPRSVYRASVRAPKGVTVKVSPSTLVFDRLNQRRSFKVAVKGVALGKRLMVSASLVWSDDSKHIVRSPIVVTKAPNF